MENSEKLTVRGVEVHIINEKRIMLLEEGGSISESEATIIVNYLFDEGFIKEGDEIICEIVEDNE